MGRAYIISSYLTCKSNAVLTNRLYEYSVANGYEVIKDIRQADVVFINTCGFTAFAQQDTEACFQRAVKDAPPGAVICAVGCLSRLKGEELSGKYRRIHMVDDLSRLDGLIKAQRAFNESTSHHYRRSFYDKVVRSPNWDSRKGRIEARVTKQLRLPGALLNRFLNDVLDDNKIVIEIGSGCLNQCSYCSIRRIKGLPVSRSIADIMAELRKVYRPGLSVNLVCDDGGSYGHDIGTDLLSLLYAMDKEYPGIPIEICYLHPRWLVAGEAAYSNAFQELNIVSLNSPVQSGSDQVLSAMKRTYRAEDVRRIFREIKRLSPQTLLWGHLIYGHPVERWGDFMKSIDAALGYDYFLYCGLSPVNEEDMEACRGRNAFSMFIKEAVMKMLQHFIFFRLIWRSWRSGPELRYGHVKTDGAK